MKNKIFVILILTLISLVLLLNCTDKKKDELRNKKLDKEYVAELLKERALKDSSMQNDPYSPFKRDPKAEFHNLNYYDPNPEFIFKSKFYENETKDTVRISGTSGEVRKVINEVYLKINYKIFKIISDKPEISQRDLASELGLSLGKTNYCLKAFISRGLVKVNNFRRSDNKKAYSYLLTPSGIEEKARVTVQFFRSVEAEYELLKLEVESMGVE